MLLLEAVQQTPDGEVITGIIVTVVGLIVRWIEKRRLKKKLKQDVSRNVTEGTLQEWLNKED